MLSLKIIFFYYYENYSKAVLNLWEFLYIIIGIILPPNPDILNYLKAHLRL